MAIIQFSEGAIAGINEAADRRNALIYLMQNVLIQGGIGADKVMWGDYAVIPKCGPKPILLKSGAEKLAQAAQFDVYLEKTAQIIEKDFVHYEVKATIKRRDRTVVCEHLAIANSEEAGIASAINAQKSTPRAWCHNILCRAEKRAYTGAIIRAWGATGYFTAEQEGMDRIDLSADEGSETVATITVEVPPINTKEGVADLMKSVRNATGMTNGEIRELAQAHGLPTTSAEMTWDEAKELQRLCLARWVMRSAIGNMSIDVAFKMIDQLPAADPATQTGLLSFAIEEWQKSLPVAAAPKPTTYNSLSID